jgi:hypothetical protein
MSTEVGKLVYEFQLKIHAQVVLRRKSDLYVLIMFIPLRLIMPAKFKIHPGPKNIKNQAFSGRCPIRYTPKISQNSF